MPIGRRAPSYAPWSAGALALAAVLGACNGDVGGPSPATPAGSDSDGGGGSTSPSTPLLASRARRLTAAEYQATLSAAIGAAPQQPIAFPLDSKTNGYTNRADGLRVTSLLAQALWDGVPAVAAQAASAQMVAPPCTPTGAGDEACATKILGAFATRAYRRPVSAVEMADLLAVFRVGIDGADFNGGLATALEVVLQSAELMYRTELGDDAKAGPTAILVGDEIAQELSFLVTGGPPDATLAGVADTLVDANARAAQARRLLALPASRGPLGQFAAEWLEIADLPTTVHDTTKFPQWNDLRTHALAGTQAFFARAALEDKADLRAIFTANWTVADATLAPTYGAATGDRVVPTTPHAGVLTEVSVLAAHARDIDSSPIQRGHLVRTRLLCQTIPPPPQTLKIDPPPNDPTLTTRERFAAHTSNPSCQGCHTMMDPIGYTLENFDATGAFRTTENGKPIDASGALAGTDVDGPLDGPVTLGKRLGASQAARECFAKNWLEFATAYAMGDEAFAKVKADAAQFVAGQIGITELLTAFVRSDAFVVRARPPH
jgi:Protein of unknown function (DUF1588)/Protein of unknown function (DUF1592)/Protein of unknown function (DUF1595)/Protein of unknown function (DUF1587)/Protein of unknown function (DUF1585)